jgi:hypothetical protein
MSVQEIDAFFTQQAERVVVPQHAHRHPADTGELSDTEHASGCCYLNCKKWTWKRSIGLVFADLADEGVSGGIHCSLTALFLPGLFRC